MRFWDISHRLSNYCYWTWIQVGCNNQMKPTFGPFLLFFTFADGYLLWKILHNYPFHCVYLKGRNGSCLRDSANDTVSTTHHINKHLCTILMPFLQNGLLLLSLLSRFSSDASALWCSFGRPSNNTINPRLSNVICIP